MVLTNKKYAQWDILNDKCLRNKYLLIFSKAKTNLIVILPHWKIKKITQKEISFLSLGQF